MDSVISFCKGLRELALFAGAGGGILGGKLLGWRTVCAVEIEPYCHSVLCQRQNEGLLPPFPIWDDVCTFDGKPWKGLVDVISGGFPCQDISAANIHAEGITGKKSGLWKEMFRIIREVRPRFAFMENSPLLTSRGLSVVLGDMAELGYHASWGVLGGRDIGAVHYRKRAWILAMLPDTDQERCDKRGISGTYKEGFTAYGSDFESRSNDKGLENWRRYFDIERFETLGSDQNETEKENNNIGRTERCFVSDWWKVEPRVGRMVDGLAARVDRLKALGNGQIPAVAAFMFVTLLKRLVDNGVEL